jgi:hypothetical protein
VEAEARAIAHGGAGDVRMPGDVPCRIRLIAFGGRGDGGGVRALPLRHCATFITGRLREAAAVLAGVQFKDPVLGLLALQDKLARGDKEPRRAHW